MWGVSCPVGVKEAWIFGFGHKGQGEEGFDPDPWTGSGEGVQLASATKK